MTPTSDDEACVLETDEAAVRAYVWRTVVLHLVCWGIGFGTLGWGYFMWAQQGANPEFRFGLKCMVVALAINLGVVRFVVPRYLFKSDVLVGRDFIAGPCIGPFCLFTGFLGYKCVLPFSDILHVNIKTRHGRIAGATVLGVGFVGIRVSFLKRPEAVLEVLYEKSSETTWHKEALFHFPQMALSEVRDLLDRHQKDKDSNERRHANVVSLAAPPRR